MCGEHPASRLSPPIRPGSSPHVRGARIVCMSKSCAGWIIPACAGSTRRSTNRRNEARDHPRMCGEHAMEKGEITADEGSSPHVRGARLVADRCRRGIGIIPACAGSTRLAASSSRQRRDHPRMCGEHAVQRRRIDHQRGSSPHVRGARVGAHGPVA